MNSSDYLRFSDLNYEDREDLEVLEVLSEDFVLFVPFVVESLIDKSDRVRRKPPGCSEASGRFSAGQAGLIWALSICFVYKVIDNYD